MPHEFASLIRKHEDSIIRTWVEEMYAERRTQLPSMLTYEQLVDHLPDLLSEISRVLDVRADDNEIIESAKHLRSHPQVRFQQGVLIDEVARELMIFRKVLNEFLWREVNTATQEDSSELRDAISRGNRLIDEAIGQTIVIYAATMRPSVETRSSSWPPPRRRRTDIPEK